MAFPNTAPNLTGLKLRRTGGDCELIQCQVDPYWGIPPGQPPMCLDPTTKLLRPFSSYQTVATAAADFVGFCKETFVPGESHSVWVYTSGWVEMKLLVAAEVVAGDYYKPTLIDAATDYVSDDTLEVADMDLDADDLPTDRAIALFRVVKSCVCQPFSERVTCPGTVPVALDESPTDAITRETQRTALFSFGLGSQRPPNQVPPAE